MADDDRAARDRLAALEAELNADADAQKARKAAALRKFHDQRVTQTSATELERKRGAAKASSQLPRARPMPPDDTGDDGLVELDGRRRSRDRDEADSLEGLGSALELATKANRVKQELTRAPGKGDKSWVASGVASLAFGPLGWLYAGSWREAVPAGAAWVILGTLAWNILPMFLMMPVLMVVMPLSAIAGVVYALQYNRSGSRQRLFDRDRGDRSGKQKQLRSGKSNDR